MYSLQRPIPVVRSHLSIFCLTIISKCKMKFQWIISECRTALFVEDIISLWSNWLVIQISDNLNYFSKSYGQICNGFRVKISISSDHPFGGLFMENSWFFWIPIGFDDCFDLSSMTKTPANTENKVSSRVWIRFPGREPLKSHQR